MKLQNIITTSVILLILIISGCTNREEEQKEVIKYVKVEKVTNHNKADKLVFNGSIHEQNLTMLSFRVGGPLLQFDIKAGDYVEKGEVIAAIDKRDYELQVNSTRSQYLQLKSEFERYKELYEQDKVPANSFEKIESGYLMAKTAFENAENQLRDTELKAPFSGYIYEKKTENFQTVGAGQPIVSMIDLTVLEVTIPIPANQLRRVKRSTNNFLTVKNSNVSDLPLKIVSISEKAGNDGMYKMKLSFKNEPSLHISPGMSAEVTMLCNTPEESLKIPSSAIFHENEKTWVWLFDEKTGTVKKQQITITKFSNGGLIEVEQGLNLNETIVTAGVHYLFEGQKVQPIKEKSESNVGGLL